jgi:hypothetical protein
LVESFSLKKNDIVSVEIREELEILFQGSGVEAERGIHPIGLQIGNILNHAIPTGGHRKPLNQE